MNAVESAVEWSRQTGIAIVVPSSDQEKTRSSLKTWRLMSAAQQAESDRKSVELFGLANEAHAGVMLEPSLNLETVFEMCLRETEAIVGEKPRLRLYLGHIPLYEDATPRYDISSDDEETGWTNRGFIRVSPDIRGGLGTIVEKIGRSIGKDVWRRRGSLPVVRKIAETADFSAAPDERADIYGVREEIFCGKFAEKLLDRFREYVGQEFGDAVLSRYVYVDEAGNEVEFDDALPNIVGSGIFHAADLYGFLDEERKIGFAQLEAG